MDSPLKQRLIGAAVLAALAIIFLPMLLKGPDVKAPDATEVPLDMPASPDQKFETRELPLSEPSTDTPDGGVLGMDTAPATEAVPDSGAQATVPVTASEPVPLESAGAPAAAAPLPETKPAAATPAPVAVIPPKPAPVDETPATAAVAGGKYVVNIGSFSNLDNATVLVNKLRAAKLPLMADKVEVGGKTAMRVRVGPFADRAAAESARQRADAIAGGTSKVVALDASPSAKPVVASKPAIVTENSKPLAEKPATPMPKVSGFAVQLAAPSVEADANALRDKARAAGFSSFVQRVETDAGVRYRVRVGPVADRSAAESLRDSVNSKLGASGIVVPNP